MSNCQNKTFFLDQHGCAKNQVDGEILITLLQNKGMVKVDDADKADLIIVNSCGFIESAKTESIGSVMDARKFYPNAKILFAGCLAERYADELMESLPEVDGILGNGDLSKVEESVEAIFNNERKAIRTPQKGVYCGKRDTFLNYPGSTFIKITEGCDNCCSFCAIPVIRGRLRSRKASDIVQEIKELYAKGVKEFNLIGQDLAAYGCGMDDDVFGNGTNYYKELYVNLKTPVIEDEFFENHHSPLYQLCKMISEIDGKFWVRLLYIHPDHFNKDVLDVMNEDKRFLPYFDIPFQSGDSEIIRSMNRKGSAESYKKVVKLIRNTLSESCIRTTFLTGFPGENEKNAKNTDAFLKEIKSDWSGCFPYSREDNTKADLMENQVNTKVSEKRAKSLEKIQDKITQESLRDRIGKIYDVLVEEIVVNENGTDEGLAIGRAWFEAPDVDGSFVIRYDLDDENAVKNIVPGNMVKVRSLTSSQVDMDGEYLGISE